MRRLFDVVHRWADLTPDAGAITAGGHSTTWSQLARDVDAWATLLLGLGVRKGDRVAVRARPTAEALTVYLAAGSVGAVFQGLNTAYTVPELEHVLADAGPTLVLDEPAGPALDVARRLGLRCGLPLADAATTLGAVDASRLLRVRAEVGERDPALLVHTSGSTGRPKGALLPHGALVLAGEVHARRWGGPGMTALCPFPINHVASLSDIFGTALVAGGRTVMLDRFDPAEVLRLLQQEQVTFWGFIPAAASLVVQSSGWQAADLSCVRHAVWGGGSPSRSLLAALRAKGLRPTGCYGSTETVGNVCFTDPDQTDDELLSTSIGRADRAYDVRVDPRSGELLVRSPQPFLGYLGRPEATAEVLADDGWLRTGDLAEELPDGSFRLVGRAREMFKSGGYNVYPREVELALEALPGVRAAAVLPVPDPLYGEVGHAVVVAPDADAEQLRRAVRSSLAAYKVPKHVTLVPSLPLLPVGKVDKAALRAQLEEAVT